MWQQVYPKIAGPAFEFIAIAVDPSGAEVPRPYLEAAGATFPSLVDATGESATAFGFKVVPNGIMVDTGGVIRYRKEGGFSNRNEADLEAVRRFARGEDPGPNPPARAVPYELGALERKLVAARMELGQLYHAQGRQAEALAAWQAALYLDPENLTIRKAIWAARFPERFHPAIDSDWQNVQLKRERDDEIAAGICGPDGCPIQDPAAAT